MKKDLSRIERKILAVLQQGLPDTRTPYADMAREISIDTAKLLEVLENWKRDGKLRRIGAVVNHFKIGLGSGAMVAWQVKAERIEEVGQILAGFDEVSHAYERIASKDWPYNIYTMIHCRNEQELRNLVERMSHACGVSKYRMLVTDRELKKVPPTYIMQ